MSITVHPARRASFFALSLSRFRSPEERIGIVGFALMLLLAMSHPLWAHGFKAGDIDIGHPWSRATQPGAKVAAGYLKLKNNGAAADRLVSVSTDFAGRTEIHEMAVDDKGVMTMRGLPDGVEIPAGGEVELKPGGLHVMFMQITGPAREGEAFKATLTFEKAGPVDVEFKVEAMGGEAKPADGGHGAHGSHGG